MDKILLVFKGSPQEDGEVAEGFRVVTAMIAMDVLPRILFVDDGIFWLVKMQLSEAKSSRSVSERLQTISDLTEMYVLLDSLTRRKLEENDLDESYNTKKLSLDEAAELITANDAVITF